MVRLLAWLPRRKKSNADPQHFVSDMLFEMATSVKLVEDKSVSKKNIAPALKDSLENRTTHSFSDERMTLFP